MGKKFTIKASEAHGRRLDPEYHHALRRTRIRSTYPSAKMGITDYELKKILPTQAQLAKCYADAEAQFAATTSKKKKGKVVK